MVSATARASDSFPFVTIDVRFIRFREKAARLIMRANGFGVTTVGRNEGLYIKRIQHGASSTMVTTNDSMANQADHTNHESLRTSQFHKAQAVRHWIARKESVCPYAPGLARFIHLPEGIESLQPHNVDYLAKELRAFYEAKEQGKRVGRWMILPAREWQNHNEAHHYAENIFWLLNAAYYQLRGEHSFVQAALSRRLFGYNRGYKGEILNPIVGHLPDPLTQHVPAKSLFYSALSPLYHSKQFYRYCPHSIIPLVYASEFQELKHKHPKVTKNVAYEMAYGGLYELFGDGLPLDLKAFKKELPKWGEVIDQVAQVIRAASKQTPLHAEESKGEPASNLSYFRLAHPKLILAFCLKHRAQLSVLHGLMQVTGANPKEIIAASFAGSGLYTIPHYRPDIQRIEAA